MTPTLWQMELADLADRVQALQAEMAPGNFPRLTVSPTTHYDAADIEATVAEFMAVYRWEMRPAYVEPDPTAAPGTPERDLADEFGLTTKVVIDTGNAADVI